MITCNVYMYFFNQVLNTRTSHGQEVIRRGEGCSFFCQLLHRRLPRHVAADNPPLAAKFVLSTHSGTLDHVQYTNTAAKSILATHSNTCTHTHTHTHTGFFVCALHDTPSHTYVQLILGYILTCGTEKGRSRFQLFLSTTTLNASLRRPVFLPSARRMSGGVDGLVKRGPPTGPSSFFQPPPTLCSLCKGTGGDGHGHIADCQTKGMVTSHNHLQPKCF
jgi:hypothetical protein